MITVGLTLEVGSLKDGRFLLEDSYDMNITGPAEWDCDSVNSLIVNSLIDNSNSDADYAQLKFFTSMAAEVNSYLVASFRRIRLKGKGYKWVLTD